MTVHKNWHKAQQLFSILISDLLVDIKLSLIKFAYDRKTREVENNGDRATMQTDLDHLEGWTNLNQIYINTTKCKTAHLGTRNTSHIYRMGK